MKCTSLRKSINIPVYECLETALRVLVAGSQDSKRWCEGVLSNPYTTPFILRVLAKAHRERKATGNKDSPASDADDEARALDLTCLALGLLTHLVQLVDDAKDVIRNTGKLPPFPPIFLHSRLE